MNRRFQRDGRFDVPGKEAIHDDAFSVMDTESTHTSKGWTSDEQRKTNSNPSKDSGGAAKGNASPTKTVKDSSAAKSGGTNPTKSIKGSSQAKGIAKPAAGSSGPGKVNRIAEIVEIDIYKFVSPGTPTEKPAGHSEPGATSYVSDTTPLEGVVPQKKKKNSGRY